MNDQEKILAASGKNEAFEITGGVPVTKTFGDLWGGKRRNLVRVQNFTTSVLGVGRNPLTTDTAKFDAQIAGGGAITVIPYVGGVESLTFYSSTNGEVIVDVFYTENITSRDLYQTLSTVIINSTTTSSVTLAAPIPAGANHIGSVDIDNTVTVAGSVGLTGAIPAGNNNIGDVDVASVIPGVGATNLGKAEDAVHASGDTGVMALAVRKDTAAAIATTDGDYAPLEVDAVGRLHTQPNITSLTPGTGATNLGKAEDTAHTSGDVGVMVLAVRQDTLAALDNATGDYTPVKVDALGRQYVAVVSTSGTPTNAIVAMAAADTEYSYSIPAGTRAVEFTMRRATKVPANSGDIVRFSFASGQVAAGSGNVKTITGDKEYYLSDHLFINATTIYFAGSVAGATMEIVTRS